jgi:hypothetical protein
VELKVKIPDGLAEVAKERGLELKAYVEEILSQQAIAPANGKRTRSPEEIRAWLRSLSQFSDKIPPLPETISREWIYQEHE